MKNEFDIFKSKKYTNYQGTVFIGSDHAIKFIGEKITLIIIMLMVLGKLISKYNLLCKKKLIYL